MLRDKSIVIIGGTAGLGLSAALACSREGANLIIVGRDDAAAESAQRELPAAHVIVGNATDPATAENAIAACVSRFGRLDALYHVAGGSGRSAGDGPLHEISDQGWDSTLQHNLTSVFLSNRAAVKQFLKRNTGGAILNMGSVLAFSPSPNFFATHAYAAAKSAIVGFSQSCAAFYAKQNIRFNVIAPGLVETPMAARAAENPAIQQFLKSKQPLDGGRIGRAMDLDAAVVMLLSDAGAWITGQVLAVDGGWCVSEGQMPPIPEGS